MSDGNFHPDLTTESILHEARADFRRAQAKGDEASLAAWARKWGEAALQTLESN
jgi:hypothetical protein